MGSCSQLKREFLKKWARGLQTYASSRKEMSFLERKKAIKLSADVAMASTRPLTTPTSWSFALISKAKNDDKNNAAVVENILGAESSGKLKKCSVDRLKFICHNKRVRSKKILKKSSGRIVGRARKKVPRAVLTSCIADRLVKKRTQVLKSLVPGGESMDDFSLIKETLDYIVSLRVQVDVMRRLATAAEFLNCKKINDTASN